MKATFTRTLTFKQKLIQRYFEMIWIYRAYKSFLPFVLVVMGLLFAAVCFWLNFDPIKFNEIGTF